MTQQVLCQSVGGGREVNANALICNGYIVARRVFTGGVQGQEGRGAGYSCSVRNGCAALQV
ncbi:hypothetical protein GCM10022265_30090 [Marinobacter xestospongiae]